MHEFHFENSGRQSSNHKGRVQITRGSIGSQQSGPADMSFGAESSLQNPFQFTDQAFENMLEVPPSDYDQNRMSEESNIFKQKLSDVSRPSNQKNPYNMIIRLPQGKNSDQILQRLMDGDSIGWRPSDSHMNGPPSFNSIRQSIENKNIRFSTESNKDGSLEIVMEWDDNALDPTELQQLIDKWNIQEPQFQTRPDRLSLIPQKPQHQGCICKKTKCLKLYCYCFSQGKLCTELCECLECCNNSEDNQERQQAIHGLIEKNPHVFKQEENQVEKVEEKKKTCNCKKSKCMKKYCECYNAGVACGPHCNCEDCHNNIDKGNKSPYLHTSEDKDRMDQELESDSGIFSNNKKKLKT